jgi:hypothetical protein
MLAFLINLDSTNNNRQKNCKKEVGFAYMQVRAVSVTLVWDDCYDKQLNGIIFYIITSKMYDHISQ